PGRPRPGPAAGAGHPAPPGRPGRLRAGSGRVPVAVSRRSPRTAPAGHVRQTVRPLRIPEPMTLYEGDLRVPAGARFAILASRWNARITDALVAGARRSLADNGVPEDA